MSLRQRWIADSLFAIQIGCALLFGITQIARMLDTTDGVSLTWFLFWAIFLALNLLLKQDGYAATAAAPKLQRDRQLA